MRDYLIHIIGALGSRFIIFFINIIIATQFAVSEASTYALTIGWANALSAIAFTPLGNLYRKLTSGGDNKISLFPYFFILVFFSLILFTVFQFFNFYIDAIPVEDSLFILPVLLGLSFLNFTSFVSVSKGKVVSFNLFTLFFYCISFFAFKVTGDLKFFMVIYALSNFIVPFFVLYKVKLLFSIDEVISLWKKNYRYILSLSLQSLLGLPVLMMLQTYVEGVDDGALLLVTIFSFLQLFNVINIVVQKVNQIFVVRILNSRVSFKLYFLYYALLFIFIAFLNCFYFYRDGDFIIFEIKGMPLDFFYFSIFYTFNTGCWLIFDVMNARGKELLLEKTSFFWAVLVLLFFLIGNHYGVNAIALYAASIGLARLTQVFIILLFGKKLHENSNSTIA